MSYSDFIDRILRTTDLLKVLTPGEPLLWNLPSEISKADDATLFGGKTITDPAMAKLVRGGLLYAVDAIDAAHRFFQDESSDLGSYWHGMVHRREGDFDNARYWFRRAGRLAFFSDLHSESCAHSATMARQDQWDAYLLTGLCERVKFGETESAAECVALQRAEFQAVFGYTWERLK